MQDFYWTIEDSGSVEIEKIKGSRFVAFAFPVSDEQEALAELAALKKQFYNATHHCFAYRLGPDGKTFRYNDDGEPSGTAGLPILRQLEGADLENILVVVIRYYGGTKLGTGGLSRAYSTAVQAVLDSVKRKRITIRSTFRLQFDYVDTSPAMYTLSQFDTKILDSHYSDRTELSIAVRRSQRNDLVESLTNALGGRAIMERVEAEIGDLEADENNAADG